MRWSGAFLVSCALASGCAAPLVLDEQEALAVIPHRISPNGQIVVEVLLNDQGPVDFALDTGASISVVFDQTLTKLGLDVVSNDEKVIQGMLGLGRFPIADVDRVQIGKDAWERARLAILPGDTPASRGIDGILGTDYLGRHALAYSQGNRTLQLYTQNTVQEIAYRGWATIPLQRLQIGNSDARVYVIDIVIQGRHVPALLDLGTEMSLMNWNAARAFGVTQSRSKQEIEVSGAIEVDDETKVARLVVNELQLANLTWRNRLFLIADLPVFEALGLGNEPMAIVGVDFFNQRDIVIDLVRERLLVKLR